MNQPPSRTSTEPRSRTVRRGLLRRSVVAVVAATALTGGLTAFPSEAQVPEVPELGFEITPDSGVVGDTVTGTIDIDDVDEHCITDPQEFADHIASGDDDTAYAEALVGWLADPANDAEPMIPIDTPQKLAASVALFAPVGLAADASSGDGETVEAAISQTFIMAFADIESVSPIDPLGSFDRGTGDGSVEVPQIDPGTQPVIATCASLPDEISDSDFYAAMDVMIAFIENNFDEPHPDEFSDPQSDEYEEMASEVFPVLLRELVEPRALGIEFFCVDDGTGSCDEEEAPEPGDPEPNDPEGPSGEEGEGGGGSQAPGAAPVKGRPSYTG